MKKLFQWVSNFKLESELKKQFRVKEFLGFDDSYTLGILFEASDVNEFNKIKKWVLGLRDQGKKVYAICYFDLNSIPENLSYPKSEFDIFSNKEMNFLGVPSSPYIRTFPSKVFDILLDLNMKNKFSLRYLAIHSCAKCKVGIQIPENSRSHDILLSIAQNAGSEMLYTQMERYIKMIHKK